MQEKHKLIVAAVLGILLLLGLWYGGNVYFNATDNVTPPTPSITVRPTIPEEDVVFCTQDVKQCPDGTFVGREGPTCEFKPCPGVK